MTSRHYLVPSHQRAEYGLAVLAWLERCLLFYSRDNLQREGFHWVAAHDCPPSFDYDSGQYCWSVQPARPSEVMFAAKGNYAAARKHLYAIALRLLEEGRPCDQRAVRQRMKGEGLK